MGILADMVQSIYNIKSYLRFLTYRSSRCFLHGLIVAAVYVCATVLVPWGLLLGTFGGIGGVTKTAIPDFKLENGRLWVEKPIEEATYVAYVKIDTSEPITETTDKLDLLAFDSAIVMDAEHMLIKRDGELATVSYADLDIGDWDRDKVMTEIMPVVWVVLAVLIVFSALFSLFGFFIGAFLAAAIGMIMSGTLNCDISFEDMYKLAVYARTGPVFLKAVLSYFITIPGFFFVNFGISAFYLWRVMKLLKEERQNPLTNM